MIQPVVKIAVYQKIPTDSGKFTYNLSAPDYWIDDFNGLTIRYGIDNSKDTVSFNMINHRERLANGDIYYTLQKSIYAKPDTRDLIKIYAYNAPLLDSLDNHLLMVAYIKSWNYESTEGKGVLKIDCYNRTEALLNSMMFAVYNNGEYVPNMIVNTINRIKTYDPANQVYAWKDHSGLSNPGPVGAYNENGERICYKIDPYDGLRKYITFVGATPPAGYTAEVGYIRAYKAAAYDATGNLLSTYSSTIPSTLFFSKPVYVQPYKPFLDHLNEISSEFYTGDEEAGTYMSYLDNANNLHWLPKQFSLGDVILERDSSSTTLGRDVDEIINAVIINCGTDPANNGVLALSYNPESMAANGARWKYVATTLVMDSIRKTEKESTSTGKPNAGNSIKDNGYPNSYPWYIQVGAADPYNNPPKWQYIIGDPTYGYVSNDAAYKEYIRRVARDRGKIAGELMVKYSGDPLYSGKYELPWGDNVVSPGDLLSLQVDSFGNEVKILRVLAVSHTFQNSWKTTLELKEDLDYNQLMGITQR